MSQEDEPSLALPACKSLELREDGDDVSAALAITPQYRLAAGATVSFRVSAAEMLGNDQGDSLGSCTNLDGKVHLHSRLGLTSEEAFDLDLDQETAEHKVVKQLLDKSIAVTADREIEEMRNCMGVAPNADHPSRNCLLPLQLTASTTVRDMQDSPHCEGKNDNAGFEPVGGSAKEEGRLELCQAAWEPLLQQAEMYKIWDQLAWDEAQGDELARRSMNRLERAVWTELGVRPEQWTGDWTTSEQFLSTVMTIVPLWADMSAKTVADVTKTLRYSEETWGRLWALRQRLAATSDTAKPTPPLSWSQLTNAEAGHLRVLGWSNATWDEIEPQYNVPVSSSQPFSQLSCAEQRAARSLGFWSHTWPMRESAPASDIAPDHEIGGAVCEVSPHRTGNGSTAWETVESVASGCFFDVARMQVVTTRPIPTLSPGDGHTHPRFHSLCERTNHDGAEVTQSFRVGLPGRSAMRSIRTMTASMESTGHPLVVRHRACVMVSSLPSLNSQILRCPHVVHCW